MPQYTATLVSPLLANGLLREKEKMILTHAVHELAELPDAVANLNNLFYIMIDEDSRFLTHREQLILALSIIYTRKGKTADWLFSRYRSILEPQNRKSVERIAACLVLSTILEKAKAAAKVTANRSGKMLVLDMKVTPSGRQHHIPDVLLSNAIKNFGQAFGLEISFSILPANGGTRQHQIKLSGAAI
jgi:exopolyphosphatase/pppGpp-phosphohydrolase